MVTRNQLLFRGLGTASMLQKSQRAAPGDSHEKPVVVSRTGHGIDGLRVWGNREKAPHMRRLRGIDSTPIGVLIAGLEFWQRSRAPVDRETGVAIGGHLLDGSPVGCLAAPVNVHQARHFPGRIARKSIISRHA
jgi:hypothetical protein